MIDEIKNQVVQRFRQCISECGIERIDLNEAGMLADIIKDLSEAEYYQSITEAMDNEQQGYSQGYLPMSYNQGYMMTPQGNSGVGYNMNQGYRWANQYGSGTRSGYNNGMSGHTDAMESMRMAMQNADPQEKEQIRQEMRNMLGM